MRNQGIPKNKITKEQYEQLKNLGVNVGLLAHFEIITQEITKNDVITDTPKRKKKKPTYNEQ